LEGRIAKNPRVGDEVLKAHADLVHARSIVSAIVGTSTGGG
jgi:hypothetical protein